MRRCINGRAGAQHWASPMSIYGCSTVVIEGFVCALRGGGSEHRRAQDWIKSSGLPSKSVIRFIYVLRLFYDCLLVSRARAPVSGNNRRGSIRALGRVREIEAHTDQRWPHAQLSNLANGVRGLSRLFLGLSLGQSGVHMPRPEPAWCVRQAPRRLGR